MRLFGIILRDWHHVWLTRNVKRNWSSRCACTFLQFLGMWDVCVHACVSERLCPASPWIGPYFVSSFSSSGSGTRSSPAALSDWVRAPPHVADRAWGTCWTGTPSPTLASGIWCTDNVSFWRNVHEANWPMGHLQEETTEKNSSIKNGNW